MAKRVTRVPVTHAVQQRDELAWVTGHEGSERDCADVLERVTRHFPDRTYRMVAIGEARADRRRKTWSIHDADHIPIGSAVLLAVSPLALNPDLDRMCEVFGFDASPNRERRGVVKSRHRRFGTYMVTIGGSKFSTRVARADLIFPVPENVLLFEKPRRRRSA